MRVGFSWNGLTACLNLQHLQQAEKEIKLHTVYAGISEQVKPELVGQAA